MGGGFESKPGGSSLVQPTISNRQGGVPGPGKQTLTEQLGGAPVTRATAGQVVQREAAEGSNGSAPSSPVNLRRVMELYLGANQIHVWNVIGDHARSVSFPDPHPRLTWVDEPAFVRELLMQLEANIADFTPLAKLDEILFPSDAARAVGPMLPATDAWSPPLGLAIAQALHIAIVSSLHRLGPRYLAVADSSSSTGETLMSPGALIYSMPIDRYVGAAMCAPRVLTIQPPDAKAGATARGKPTGLRPTRLAWEGARDPHLWNWVRATEPADATAEEVAAALWTVTDHHGETNAAFNAYLLAAAPPLFGIPKRFAIKNPNARQYAPAHALTGEDSTSAELVDVAKSSAGDDIALHQSPAGPSKSKAGLAAPTAPPPELGPLLGMVSDCNLQLGFVTTEIASWGLADRVAPALAFVARKSHELATADAKALTDWNRVISGQRDRLFKISGAIHNLASTARKLGVRDPKSPEATPVREILELLATAAGTSHLAQTSEAKLQQGLELQAGLNARAVQASERDLEGAHLEFRATMGDKGANSAGAYSPEIADLQQRSRRLQTTMINGGEVDTAEVDEVTLRSGEIALRERVLGTIHSTFELQEAAMVAKEGLAAHIAMLFSGKFRNLEGLCQHIRDRVTPIQNELIATGQQIHDAEQNQVGTPPQKAKHRAMRRAVLARTHTEFAKIAADEDLQHFFREGAQGRPEPAVPDRLRQGRCADRHRRARRCHGRRGSRARRRHVDGSRRRGHRGGALHRCPGRHHHRQPRHRLSRECGGSGRHPGRLAQGGVRREPLHVVREHRAVRRDRPRVRRNRQARGPRGHDLAKADTFAQKAFVAGREVGAITVHTVWGAAIGYVAHRTVGGHESNPMEARDWMLQGASVAIGRGVHKALGARMPGLERLAKRSTEARRLVLEAQQLQQLASNVEHGKNPATAVELLDQRTKLLREEIEAIEHIVARDGDASGELGKMRQDLEHQVHESHTRAMLETKFHLLGLEELVPGALWKGSDEQIQHALQEARANGGKVSAQEPHSKRWKLVLDGREVEIQEVAEDHPRLHHAEVMATPRERRGDAITHHRGGRYGVAGDLTEEALNDPHPTPEVRDLQERARKAHPDDIEAQKDYIFRQFRSGNLRVRLLLRRASDIGIVSNVLQDFGIKMATPDIIARVFDYVFDSAGIGFHYDSYAAWSRIAVGRGTIADARFIVHEAAEIGIMSREGVDFMGKSVAVGTPKHEQWFEGTFEPAYERAHAKALYAEYQFLAEQIVRVIGEARGLSPEIIAAIDPASDEGRKYMTMPDGTPLIQHPRLPVWSARGQEEVALPQSVAARLGTTRRISLRELVRVIRNMTITAAREQGATNDRSSE